MKRESEGERVGYTVERGSQRERERKRERIRKYCVT